MSYKLHIDGDSVGVSKDSDNIKVVGGIEIDKEVYIEARKDLEAFSKKYEIKDGKVKEKKNVDKNE